MKANAGFTGSLESREPEKTPLIDMVFLLLVFFFVNLSVTPISRTTKVHTFLQEDVKRSFLKVPQPAEYDARQVLLVEILDANVISTRNRLLSIRSRIDQCAALMGCTPLHIPPIGTEAGAVRFWVSLFPLDRLEQRVSSWGSNCPGCGELRAAEESFPIPWGEGMVNNLANRLQAMGFNGGGDVKKVHVRVPESFPAGEFLSCFYDLVQMVPGLDRDNIYVRALEEKI